MTRAFRLATVLSTFIISGLVASAQTPSPRSTGTTAATPSAPALTVVKNDSIRTYSLDEIKRLPATEGWGGLMTSAGSISGVFTQKGVSLVELLSAVGGVGEGEAVRIQAKDGYAMTISSRQLTAGDFTTFDCSSGKELPHEQLTMIVSYEEDGKPIDPRIGPLRISILSGKTQVTEGHWWIKWVNKLEVVTAFKPWSLKLEGVVTVDIDAASFQSCAAPKCHGITWTDGSGREWQGVALWRLVGKVDDSITNRGDVFEDALADRVYAVHITSTDGRALDFASARAKRNDELLVAYMMDGLPLTEDYWPLRLVGPDLESADQLAKVARISVVLP